MKKINCIQIFNAHYEMKLKVSDLPGYYKYELIPMELGYERTFIYIMPDRKGYLFHGKNLDSRNVNYFYH